MPYVKHGHSAGVRDGGRITPEYRAWRNMLNRCGNPRDERYQRYGARGIGVCSQWLKDFSAFLSDMGLKPSPDHSLDRINNNGNYEPANCRWATRSEQNKNRNPEFFDKLRRQAKKAALIRWHSKGEEQCPAGS